jgi:hypothetical protein
MDISSAYITVMVFVAIISFFAGMIAERYLSKSNRVGARVKHPEPVISPGPWGWGVLNLGVFGGQVRVDILECTEKTYAINIEGRKEMIPKTDIGWINGGKQHVFFVEAHEYEKPAKRDQLSLSPARPAKEIGTFTDAFIDPTRFESPKIKA